MANWVLQYPTQIVNGPTYKVKAEHLVDNFNGLKSDIDDRLSRITTTSQTVAGAVTWGAAQTFSAAVALNNSVTFSQKPVVPAINIVVTSDGSPINGDVWYNSTGNQLKARINGATVVLGASVLSGYISGPRVLYATANTITIPNGMVATDDTNTTLISVTSNITLSLATSGAAGLDTGSEAANTWYYPWLIRRSSDGVVSAIFSTSRTSPTMPSGYDQKRRLPLAVRNDGSSNIIPFVVGQGWPYTPFIEYNVAIGDHITVGSHNLLAGIAPTTAGTFQALDISSLVPPISTMAYLKGIHLYSSTGGRFQIRATGESHNGFSLRTPTSSTTDRPELVWHQLTNGSQSIDWTNTGTSTQNWLWVAGFTVNE